VRFADLFRRDHMSARTPSPILLLGAITLIAVACAAPPKRADSTASSSSSAPVDDRALLARLERDARALAKTDGCTTADACRTAPVGSRACGGPRAYVVYCAATTDSVALYRKLDSLREAEAAYNQKSGLASTCEMRMPPMPNVREGRCTDGR
jgi:hypothetical protein